MGNEHAVKMSRKTGASRAAAVTALAMVRPTVVDLTHETEQAYPPPEAVPALSLVQPWAWAILHAGKRIENRNWPYGCAQRGPIWLHASKGVGTRSEFDAAVEGILDVVRLSDLVQLGVAARVGTVPGLAVVDHTKMWVPSTDLPRGAIVGRAEIVGVVKDGRIHRDGASTCEQPTNEPLLHLDADYWTGGFALVLDRVAILREPVPCAGALGFWWPGAEIEARCHAQLPPLQPARGDVDEFLDAAVMP